MLTGRSGCGKSQLLRQLKRTRIVKIYSIEEVIETLISEIIEGEDHWCRDVLSLFDGAEVAAVEDLDVNLRGKSDSQKSLACILSHLGENVPVVLTACQAEPTIPYLIDAIPGITILRHISSEHLSLDLEA